MEIDEGRRTTSTSGYEPFRLLSTLFTREDSVILTLSSRGARAYSVISALGTRETRKDPVISGLGTLGAREDSSQFSSRCPSDRLAVGPASRRNTLKIGHLPSGCAYTSHRGSGEKPRASLVVGRFERARSTIESVRLNRMP